MNINTARTDSRWLGVTGRDYASQILGALTMAGVSLLGLASFFYPFFLSALPTQDTMIARAGDAPVIFGLLMPLLLILILAELGGRQASAKKIAALGILTAINSVLRIPIGIGDSPSFFFLPILLGYVYGARFGFLHGALSVFVSALLTAGIGPWLPFQMFALGWLGMGAAVLRPLGMRLPAWGEVGLLAVYGYIGGTLFGVLINLYSWPWTGSMGGLGWQPGMSLQETLNHYWIFYLTTSLTWDTLRGCFTAAFILVLGKPLLYELRRFHQRFSWRVEQD